MIRLIVQVRIKAIEIIETMALLRIFESYAGV